MSGLGLALKGLNLAARLTGAKAALAKVPPKVWIALAIILAAVTAFIVHQHYAHKALKAADAAGYARAKAEDDRALAKLRATAATVTTNGKVISMDTRSKNDETNRAITVDAGDLRLRGPGAASCGRVDHPAVPAASGQPGPSSGIADAAGSPLPSADGQPDLAAVPWQWLVGRAEQADLDRAEVLSWRDWYQRQAAEWAKLKAPAPSK